MNIFEKISLFFKRWHNKFFAILFISLAILLFLAHYLYCEIVTGWRYLVSDPMELFNLVIYAIVYGVILYGNIKNNNIAYTGILLFLCMLVVDCLFDVIQNARYGISLESGTIFLVLYLIQITITVSVIVVGIVYYLGIQKYINFQSEDFKRLRILGIIFSSLLFVELLPIIILQILSGWYGALGLLLAFALPLSELFTSISCIWTVERLERK